MPPNKNSRREREVERERSSSPQGVEVDDREGGTATLTESDTNQRGVQPRLTEPSQLQLTTTHPSSLVEPSLDASEQLPLKPLVAAKRRDNRRSGLTSTSPPQPSVAAIAPLLKPRVADKRMGRPTKGASRQSEPTTNPDEASLSSMSSTWPSSVVVGAVWESPSSGDGDGTSIVVSGWNDQPTLPYEEDCDEDTSVDETHIVESDDVLVANEIPSVTANVVSPEELQTADDVRRDLQEKVRKRYFWIATACVVVILISVVVPVAITSRASNNRQASPTPGPDSIATPNPTTSPLTQKELLQSILLLSDSDIIRDSVDLAKSDEFSLQNRTMNWLAYSDPLQLIPVEKTDISQFSPTERRRIVDRYALNVIYYSVTDEFTENDDITSCVGRSCFATLSPCYKCNENDDIQEFFLYDSTYLSGISIPKEVGALSTLEVLNLGRNEFDGSIPTEIFMLTRLRNLDLYGNDLRGPISTEISKLSNLEELRLGFNLLMKGTIPTEIGSLTKLTWLELDYNRLSGSIPSEFGLLTSMNRLDLGANNLSGTIPTAVGEMESLELFVCRNNTLSGTIPSEVFSRLKSLTYLDLAFNSMSGTVPTHIGQLTQLRSLYLYGNNFSATIPTEIGLLTNLGTLILEDNNFFGTIPTEIGLLSSLDVLRLAGNNLSGTIPTVIGLLSNLVVLRLAGNNLSGTIPTEIVLLSNLEWIHLDNNNLTDDNANNLFCNSTNLCHECYNETKFPNLITLGITVDCPEEDNTTSNNVVCDCCDCG